MAEPTTTLQTLRRSIAKELQMPFFRRFPAGYSEVDTSSTTTEIIDAALKQKSKFWNGSWFYHVEDQETSLIRAHLTNEAGVNFQLETPLSSTPTNGDDYEIHTIWNAIDIHYAINQALQEVQRIYPDTITDETYVLEEDKLEYALSSLSTAPWMFNELWIEYNTSARRGTVQSATNSTIEVESSSVTSGVTTDWYVSIYAGTGSGQLRAVTSASGTTVTISTGTTNWDTNPDSTSKYCLWDASEQLTPWKLVEGWGDDAPEFPDTLYLHNRFTSQYGMRLRMKYLAYPSELSAEADTTGVPARYIISKACSFLYGQRLKDNKVDRDTFFAESERYREMADRFLAFNQKMKPNSTIRSPRGSEYWREDDPLGWRR